MGRIAKFWLLVLGDVIRNFIRDDCSFMASGIAFYAFLSLFPMCLVSVTFIGWILSVPWIHDQAVLGLKQLGEMPQSSANSDGFAYTVSLLQSVLPTQSNWVTDELATLSSHIGRNVFISVIVGLWSGRHMFMAMEYSLQHAWNMPVKRNWVQSSLVSMYLILVCSIVIVVLMGGVGVLALVSGVLIHLPLPSFWGFSLDQALVWSWVVSWILHPLGVSAIFLMVYRLLPSERLPILMLLPGSLFSGIAWKLSSWCYLEYGIRIGSISAVYGSIWYIMGLVGWLYIVATVFLIGAEIVYSYSYQISLITGKRLLPTKL